MIKRDLITMFLCVPGAGLFALGTGMCMTMLWGMLVPGVAVGFAGIVLLLCLIPLCRGIKE